MPQLPQLRDIRSVSVGFEQPRVAPNRGLIEGLEGVRDNVNEYQAEVRKKEDERDRIWARQQVTEARARKAEADSARWANGEDLTGLPDRVGKDFDADMAKRRAAAPSANAARYLDIEAPALKTDFVTDARVDADKYLVQKNFTGLVSGVEAARGLVFNSPGTFAKTYAEQKTLIDSIKMPVELRTKMDLHLKELGASAVQGMIENGNPYEAAKQLKGGAWNKYVDPDRLAALTNQAQSEIKRREAEARANQAAARAEASIDASELMRDDIMSRQATGQGVKPEDVARIKAGLTDKQWEKYQSAAAKADAVYKLTGDLRTKSLVEIQNTIEAARPKAGAGFAEQQAAYEAAQAVAKSEIARRKADPASAVREAFPRVNLAWDQANANPSDPGQTRVAIKRTLAAQETLGIPSDQRKPLPAQVALSIAGDIRGAPAAKAAAKVKEYAEFYGENWPTVFRQISGNLDANTLWATTLDDKNKAAILLETSRTAGPDGKPGSGVPALRKALGVPDRGAGSLTTAIAADDDVRNLAIAMSRRGGGGSTAISINGAAETLALGLMQRNGTAASAAVDSAVKALVRDKYNFGRVNGVPFVTPKTVDADTAERGARKLQSDLKGDGLDLPFADPGALDKDTREQYVSAIKRNGYWVTLPGNKGLELWAGDAPVTRYGRPIQATWDVLTGVAPGISAADRMKANQDRYKTIFKKVGE
jgi:hypothetical protein